MCGTPNMLLEHTRTPYMAGHSYTGITVANNANVHLGDSYQFSLVNCKKNHKGVAQPDFNGLNNRSLQTVGNHIPRHKLRAQMRSQLHENNRARDCAAPTILTVCGLGGVGKTQLVLDYITAYRSEYAAIVWLDALSLETLEKDYVRIYTNFFASYDKDESKNISNEMRIRAVNDLPNQGEGRWLFIFDSADNIDYPEATEYIDLQYFLPDAACVDVIVTTRSRTARNMTSIEGIEVGELEPSEARELFLRRSRFTRESSEDCAEIDRITKELGYLALTVNLAATYINTFPDIRIEDYLVEYGQRIDLLSQRPKRLVDGYDKSTIATWETTYAAIEAQCTRAPELLAFLAFLSPNDIFRELFTKSENAVTGISKLHFLNDLHKYATTWGRDEKSMTFAIRQTLSRRVNKGKGEVVDASRMSGAALKGFSKAEFEDAFEKLSSFSFVGWQDERQAYTMHKLVRDWAYERLKSEEQTRFCVGVCNRLLDFASGLEENPAMSLRLVPHIMSCFSALRRQCKTGLLVVADVMEIVTKLADFLKKTGQTNSEYELRIFAFEHLQEQSEGKRAEFLEAMRSLALVMQRQGHYVKAEIMFNQAYNGMRDLLGLEHEDTLQSMSELALVLQDQGEYSKSEKLLRGALRSYTRRLGKCHADTLSCSRNLALVVRQLGRYEESERMLRQTLERWHKSRRQTSPNRLTTLALLGLVLQDQAKYDEAEQQFRWAVDGYTRSLGPSHQDTLTALGNLASILKEKGDLEEAEQIFRQVLQGRQDLGSSHPTTLVAVNDLAVVLHDQQQYEEAEKLFRQALDGYATELTTAHPHVLTGKMNLGQVLLDQGEYEDAEVLYQAAFEGYAKALGESHPDTLRSIWKLAYLAKARQLYDVACLLYSRAVQGFNDTLGVNHPLTIECCAQLEEVRSMIGESQQEVGGGAQEESGESVVETV